MKYIYRKIEADEYLCMSIDCTCVLMSYILFCATNGPILDTNDNTKIQDIIFFFFFYF